MLTSNYKLKNGTSVFSLVHEEEFVLRKRELIGVQKIMNSEEKEKERSYEGWDNYSFFKVKFYGGKKIILLNNNHPFVYNFMEFREKIRSELKYDFDLFIDSLLISFSESKFEIEDTDQHIIDMLEFAWSSHLGKIYTDDF